MASVTIRNVAEKAGVSTASVSRILNSAPGYRHDSETQERVRAAAALLGYKPHSAASVMRAKRTHLIGILAQRFSNEFGALVRDALVQALQEHPPYKPIFIDPLVLGGEDADYSFGYELLEGLFWSLPPRDDALLEEMLARPGRRPEIVTINRSHSPDLPVSSVLVNRAPATCEVTEYLIGLGHRRIAILYRAPPGDNARFAGFQQAFARRGLKPDEHLCLPLSDRYEPDSYLQDGEELMKELMRKNAASPPTAVVCHNDEVAAGVLQAAYQLGLSVPADVSVVGFGVARASRFAVPPLTTVVEPVAEIAAAAVDLMIRRLEKPTESGNDTRMLTCSVHLSKSCAPPR